jgi:hypothetical protein
MNTAHVDLSDAGLATLTVAAHGCVPSVTVAVADWPSLL